MLLAAPARAAEPLTFELTFDQNVSATPFTGRVFVMLTKKEITELPAGVSWFSPEPVFALDVKDWKPGTPLVLGNGCLGHPVALDKLPKDTYSIVAVMDFDRGSRRFTHAEGNGYSAVARRELDPASTGPVKLTVDKIFHEPKFAETERVKLVEVESKLLTAFHGRPTSLRAGVILPASHAKEPDRRYPVVYEIPGFGGTHTMAQGVARREPCDLDGVEVIWVVLDPSSRWGHHVFADSANNGPCGRALCEELIPAIEKKHRGVGTPAARFVTGHSSGGWSSLWLQVTYPDFFGGCWSTAPDSVDFRDFQLVDVYKDDSLFFDKDGKLRPLARKQGKPILFTKNFSDMETIWGHGGQLGSFEAVFGPKGADGRPRPLWDRATGKIDRETAKTWEKYDIRLCVERRWPEIGPKLKGKVHVYMGAEDTFYLNGATAMLKDAFKQLGSDAVVEIFPGRDHFTLIDKELRQRISKEMADSIRKNTR